MNRNFGLDLARAVAVSFVLLAHFVKQFDILGFWGVELFFALSGYLIGQILWRNFSSNDNNLAHVSNFWSRRWYRTLPNYFLFLVIMIPFHKYYFKDLPPVSDILKFLWFGQGLLSQTPNFYRVSWSLCIEEWFYLIFPLFLFSLKLIKFKAKQAFFISIIFFFLIEFFTRFYLINSSDISVREITLARLDAIASGVFVAVLTRNFNLKKIQIASLTGAFMWVVILFVSVKSDISFSEMTQRSNFLLTFVPLSFALMLPIINTIKRPSGIFLFTNKIIESLSLWSYSLYLSHIPILFLFYSLFSYLHLSGYLNIFPKVLSLITTIFISKFLYKYFEHPLMLLRPKEIK